MRRRSSSLTPFAGQRDTLGQRGRRKSLNVATHSPEILLRHEKGFLPVLDEELFHGIIRVVCVGRVAVLQNCHNVLIFCLHQNCHVQWWPHCHTDTAWRVHISVVSVIVQPHEGRGLRAWSSKIVASVKIIQFALNKSFKYSFCFLMISLVTTEAPWI